MNCPMIFVVVLLVASSFSAVADSAETTRLPVGDEPSRTPKQKNTAPEAADADDWRPIIWPSTRLPAGERRVTQVNPNVLSTRIVRPTVPTVVRRPLPTIVAAPRRTIAPTTVRPETTPLPSPPNLIPFEFADVGSVGQAPTSGVLRRPVTVAASADRQAEPGEPPLPLESTTRGTPSQKIPNREPPPQESASSEETLPLLRQSVSRKPIEPEAAAVAEVRKPPTPELVLQGPPDEDDAPARTPPVEEAPARKSPVQETPVPKLPVQEAPAREEAVVPEASVQEVPVDASPVGETLDEGAAVEETPAVEVAVDEAPTKGEPEVPKMSESDPPAPAVPIQEPPAEAVPNREVPDREVPDREVPDREEARAQQPLLPFDEPVVASATETPELPAMESPPPAAGATTELPTSVDQQDNEPIRSEGFTDGSSSFSEVYSELEDATVEGEAALEEEETTTESVFVASESTTSSSVTSAVASDSPTVTSEAVEATSETSSETVEAATEKPSAASTVTSLPVTPSLTTTSTTTPSTTPTTTPATTTTPLTTAPSTTTLSTTTTTTSEATMPQTTPATAASTTTTPTTMTSAATTLVVVVSEATTWRTAASTEATTSMTTPATGSSVAYDVDDVTDAANLTTSAPADLTVTADFPNGNDSTMVAVTVSIAAIMCLALLVLLLFVIRRRRARAVQGTCQPARMDAYSMDNVSPSNTWQRGKMRSSLRASKRSYLNQAFDDPSAFSMQLTAAQLALYMEKPASHIEDEFGRVANSSTVRLEELPAGVESKNRYANVLPVPETRVKIGLDDEKLASPEAEDDLEHYINANYVRGPKEELRHYIACQAPLESTVADFWQMIWENQCRVIVQLTDLSEGGVARCAEYLPPSEVLDCHRLYGDYQVTLKSRELRDNYVTSYLQLKRMEDNLIREVTHLWYTSWPATGVPSEVRTVVALLLEARKGQSKDQPAPVVVHCSPGTGRTGTALAIDVCLRHIDSSRSIDIPRCVNRLRQDRPGCVQTKEQYLFIYKAVNYYASQLSNAALDSL